MILLVWGALIGQKGGGSGDMGFAKKAGNLILRGSTCSARISNHRFMVGHMQSKGLVRTWVGV